MITSLAQNTNRDNNNNSMGVIGSACCAQEKNENKQAIDHSPRRPTLPTKVTISTTLSSKPSNNFPPEINVYLADRNNNSSFDADNQTNKKQCQKPIDISKVLQDVYPPPKPITWDSFNIQGVIGQGGFGKVFLAELKENKEQGISEKYAIKRVTKEKINHKKLIRSLKLEKKIMRENKNKFIMNLYYTFCDREYLYFVMEYASGGDTYSLINQKSLRFNDFKQAGQDAVRFLLGCLILGLEHLHTKGYMYRDIKPENILLLQDGYAKLSDFGLAKQIDEGSLAKTEAGTGIYFAPEMVTQKGYGLSVDIWAIGVYAYELSNYSPPFAAADMKDKYRVRRVVENAEGHRLWKNPYISDQLKDFIDGILRYDPEDRLGINGFDQLKQHEFFSSVDFDWQKLETGQMVSPLRSIIEANKSRVKPYDEPQLNLSSIPHYVGFESLENWTSPWRDE